MGAVSDQQLDDLQDVVHRFRRSPLAAGALPSTGHALVRALLTATDPERRQRLLDVLDDRMNYGVFLDTHTANMCMDAFLKEGNHRGKRGVGRDVEEMGVCRIRLLLFVVVNVAFHE